MFGTLLDKTVGYFEKRFAVVILLPCVVFWGGVALLVAIAWGWQSTAQWWESLLLGQQIMICGVLIFSVVVFALLVRLAVVVLIRAYEGGWLLGTPPGRWLLNRQSQRWKSLDLAQSKDYSRRYQELPAERADLRPTRLGNALVAAESYVRDERRFGIDPVFFWPRLYPLLPEAMRAALDDVRSTMEQMLLIATLAGAFAVIAAAFGISGEIAAVVWLPVACGSALLAVAVHHAAIAAAVRFGELVRASFDTGRVSLLKSYGLKPPGTMEAERELWRALAQQLYRRDADRPELLVFDTDS